MYSPRIQQTNWATKVSDKLFGTNFTDTINNANKYEYQKATNINKYAWNVQGMQQAGINPLANAAATGSVAQSAAGSSQSGDMGDIAGGILNGVKDILHEVNPMNSYKELKGLVRSFL